MSYTLFEATYAPLSDFVIVAVFLICRLQAHLVWVVLHVFATLKHLIHTLTLLCVCVCVCVVCGVCVCVWCMCIYAKNKI